MLNIILCVFLFFGQSTVGVYLDRDKAIDAYRGGCINVNDFNNTNSTKLVKLVFKKEFFDNLQNRESSIEVTHALVLALGDAPVSKEIDINLPVPEGWYELGTVEGQRKRVIAQKLQPTKICK